MANPDIQDNILPPTNSIPENNFDKLQKKYPDQKDKINFLSETKFNDVKEQLSQTIDSLIKENIVSQEDFWKNIQQVIENLFSDPYLDIDIIAKTNQAENLFIFRSELENLNKKKMVDITNETVDITNETVDITNEKIEKSRLLLETKYSQIDAKYKIDTTTDEFKKLKESTPNINKIPPDKQDLYVSYLYASEKIITESQDKKLSKDNYQFVEGFISLNKELGVESSISLDGFDIIEDEIDESTDKNKKTDVTERSMEDIVQQAAVSKSCTVK